MRKNEKNNVFNKFKQATLVAVAAAAVASSLAAPAFAQEGETKIVDGDKVKFVVTEHSGLGSNTDSERRAAIEEKFNIKLDASDVWADKKGEMAYNPDGSLTKYTSHDELKALGIYATNANRQELIQYAIRTNDWQPYRAFSAMESPAYFEVVDNKLEYNKVYFGHLIESMISYYNTEIQDAKVIKDEEKASKLQSAKQKYLDEYVPKFNNAPGVTPYVSLLNGNEKIAKETGAVMYEDSYFDSKYNHPDVKAKGVFKDGSNPHAEFLNKLGK